ncbi:ATP-dependent DNA helicase [Hydrogenophaga sp.]|uniref:ATP-dependent DNA helicase n=1 Tax=Hydrogenophaga sp. TaxID=1904254 RepID=UPI002721952A|nr:ATP-dependent DNA helicase [Hydrogenophaga sp.]MDO8903061.1 ATP-dependent DNA helicase [Hydrogenophaga sp.]
MPVAPTDELLPMPDGADAPLGEVAVRTLCDFAARNGDLDLRFSASPSGQEGVAGHNTVAARRGPAYQRELPLSATWRGLRVQGRADGFDNQAGRLEEIKTHRGDPARIKPSQQALHWAQVRVYGWMLCDQLGLTELDIALVYFHIDTGVETPLLQRHQSDDLRAHFEGLCERYIAWARSESLHRFQRDTALRALAFPFPSFRAGQRPLAEAVYRHHGAARTLLAQAPTGIGKTVATLFAALKAAPAANTDQLLYLTAKTTGRALALDGLRRLGMAVSGATVRVLERVARDKACEHTDKACHGESCPLARGFHDRLPAARENAARTGWLDQTSLRDVALRHQVCPYHLGQEMLRWSDVVVGDYNHFFDLHAHAWALAVDEGRRVALLVDEAHNLIERARQMYSAELHPATLAALRLSPPAGLGASLDRLHRAWGTVAIASGAEHALLDELPEGWVTALQLHSTDLTEHLARADDAAHPVDPRVQAWLFEVLGFLRLAENFADHSLVELTRTPLTGRARKPRAAIAIRNLVPGPMLAARWSAAQAVTLFSATLTPMNYVTDLLGLPSDTTRLDVPSPFSTEQLAVRVAPHISTRWRDRAGSLDELVMAIATQYQHTPGNYLAFFSSFDYLQQALARLQSLHPTLPVWAQSRAMNEPEREAFIARFTEAGQGVGFAVLGGAFGEGIDLPGRRLVGAFIATLGLPQVNPLNERLRQRLQRRFGRGYDYAYQFPGLQKVVQAAGRVIRSEDDRGVVLLLDDRFARGDVRRLLPAWWHVETMPSSL